MYSMQKFEKLIGNQNLRHYVKTSVPWRCRYLHRPDKMQLSPHVYKQLLIVRCECNNRFCIDPHTNTITPISIALITLLENIEFMVNSKYDRAQNNFNQMLQIIKRHADTGNQYARSIYNELEELLNG